METVTNAASNVAAVATDAASNVASVASRAIWGEPAKDTKTNETAGKEPVSGEVGDVKSGEPYDKGNEVNTPTTASEPKSLTKTTSRELPSSDSTADLPSTSNTHASKSVVSPTETLATTHIEPLKDEKKDPKEISTGGSSLAQQVKTGSSGTDSTGAEEGVKSLKIEDKAQGLRTDPLAPKVGTGVTGTETHDTLGKKDHTVTSASTPAHTSTTTPAHSSPLAHNAASTSTSTPSKVDSSTSDSKDKDHKMSLKEKIKAKLHHNKN